jgi:hypothetical protein
VIYLLVDDTDIVLIEMTTELFALSASYGPEKTGPQDVAFG